MTASLRDWKLPNYKIIQLPNFVGTFDFPAVSVILESDDLTGRQRVPSRKRAEETDPHYFDHRSRSGPGFRGLVEPLLAGRAYRRKVLFVIAEAGFRNGVRHLLCRSRMEAASPESRAVSL